VETGRTVYPSCEGEAQGWTAAVAGQGMSHGHYLRSAQCDSLGDAAARDGLWFWNELLAPTTRLAGTWHLAVAPFRFAGLAGASRTNRLVTGHRGRKFDPDSFWRRQTGPNPTDRAKLGSKRHLICDGRGVPLAIQLTGANRNDSRQALALVDAIPALQGKHGRPRRRPNCVLGDRGYDAEAIRQDLRDRRIIPFLAMRNTEHGSGLGRWRWVVERTFAWLNQFRRLRVRYEKPADVHEAFLSLGCVLICWNTLESGATEAFR